jgi:hypothetical protein
MNIQKAEARAALSLELRDKAHGLGINADDELLKLEGAVGAYRVAQDILTKNKAFYKKQLHAEEITQEEYALVMLVIDRDIGALTSLETTARVEKDRKAGEINAFKRVSSLLVKESDREVQKLQGLKDSLESGDVQIEDGVRPQTLQGAVTDIAERRAQAKEAKEPEKEPAKPKAKKRTPRKKTTKKTPKRKGA